MENSTMTETPDLRFFSPGEFHRGGTDWLPLMSPRLLVLIDTFRLCYGAPCAISPHPRALGRRDGSGPDDSFSQHNIDRWSEVRAVDLIPRGMSTRTKAEEAHRLAAYLGFTGIGIYPDWQPAPGIHLDVRVDEAPRSPALWGGIVDQDGQQVYVGLEQALTKFPEKSV